ncbi:MAG: type VI secretion system ATPase TssH [Desulfobacteraceae bacterium]|nr:type VI secretion system ATPase TssH [Desulfobacteraceae bacterium]
MDHDIKSLFSKLNDQSTNVLHNAVGLCVSRTNYEITVEQFLLKSLEDTSGDIQVILRYFEIDPARVSSALTDALEDQKAGNPGKPTFSPLLVELFEKAWMLTSIDLGARRVRTGAILTAFLTRPTYFGSGPFVDLLKKINRETLQTNFWKITEGSAEQQQAPQEGGQSGDASGAPGPDGYLAKYCQDFTAKAAAGNIDPVFGREEEIHQIIDVLARRRKNNPILVGEPGVGKTAVIEGLALRITEDDVPEMLQNVTLLGLDMGALEAGAGMKGEFENRLKGVLSEIKASEKPIILFIDEAHTLIGAGGSAGSSDAANLLKPALARGEIKTCAATTWSEYKKYFEKDPALARRFQLIKLAEPDVSVATLILRGLKDNYEASHKVIVRDDAIVAAAEYADRYISGRFLPDKAIDLLDTSCARIKINLTAKPPVLTDAQRARQALEREKRALDRDRDNGIEVEAERYEQLLAAMEDRDRQIENITARWQQEKNQAAAVVDIRNQIQAMEGSGNGEKEALNVQLAEAAKALAGIQEDDPMVRIEVCPDVVGKVVSDWTGIPLGKIQRDQVKTILNIEERLGERIKGQDHAIAAIGEVIKAAKSGIKNPDQPLGVFLLVGPSGVGKTETGLGVADLLFGGEHNIVTINMSEFQERHSTSRLIGSPPGYVGYGEGGMLSEAVRQNPYSVVLLDEVEKAHPDVMNLFYQVFDKGTLSDGEGKDINFKNTVIILTSNLATDVIQEMTHGEEDIPPMDAVMGAVRPLLSKHFKPALLARMTVVPYYSLNPVAMARVVGLKLARLQKTMQQNNKIKLTYGDDVVEQITARCAEVETGARNIDYILQGKVMPQISQTLLQGMGEDGELPGTISLTTGEQGEFQIAFG